MGIATLIYGELFDYARAETKMRRADGMPLKCQHEREVVVLSGIFADYATIKKVCPRSKEIDDATELGKEVISMLMLLPFSEFD